MSALLKNLSMVFAILWGGLALAAVWSFLFFWMVGFIVI
jgi:hypothetical protein